MPEKGLLSDFENKFEVNIQQILQRLSDKNNSISKFPTLTQPTEQLKSHRWYREIHHHYPVRACDYWPVFLDFLSKDIEETTQMILSNCSRM